MKRKLSFITAMLILASSMAACGSDAATDDTSADTTAPVETEAPGREAVKDNIPDDFNLNGATIGVLGLASWRGTELDGGGEETGDVINDAVFKRTRTVEERLNFTLEVTESNAADWKEYGKYFEQSILAGDNPWQILFSSSNATIQSGRDYMFMDLSDNKYIDLDQPWWWKNAMEEISLDGKSIRYLVGDIAVSQYLQSGCIYFNKPLFESYGESAEDLYQRVIDREWTWDKLKEYSEAMYQDLNGNSEADDGDQFGFLVDSVAYLQYCEYSTGIQYYVRDENGHPVMEYDVERAEAAVNKFISVIRETKGSKFENDWTHQQIVFAENKAIFYAGQLNDVLAEDMRNMKNEYGIIPYPLIDDQQKEYTNLIYNSAKMVSVPVTCENPDEVGAVIEALCAESYRTVIEPFYEIALKVKYSSDDYSGQCIDIIRDTAVKNFMYEYNGVVGGGGIIANQIINGKNTFASKYASTLTSTNKKIQDMIEELNSAIS